MLLFSKAAPVHLHSNVLYLNGRRRCRSIFICFTSYRSHGTNAAVNVSIKPLSSILTVVWCRSAMGQRLEGYIIKKSTSQPWKNSPRSNIKTLARNVFVFLTVSLTNSKNLSVRTTTGNNKIRTSVHSSQKSNFSSTYFLEMNSTPSITITDAIHLHQTPPASNNNHQVGG